MTASRAPRAIIFDLDGTLVDTVGTRVDAWMAVFPRFGIEPHPEYLAPLMGSDGKYLARMVAEAYGVDLRPGDDARIDFQAGAEFRVLNANPRTPLHSTDRLVAPSGNCVGADGTTAMARYTACMPTR